MYVFVSLRSCSLSKYTSLRVTRVLRMKRMKTTPLMATRNMVAVAAVVERGCLRKKRCHPSPKVRPLIHPFRLTP